MRAAGVAPLAFPGWRLYDCGLLILGRQVIAFPAAPIIRRRGWVLAAWAALFVLFAPRACHVQQVLALRGGTSEATLDDHARNMRAAGVAPLALPGWRLYDCGLLMLGR